MNDTTNQLELVERLAMFGGLRIGHKFLFVGPNVTEFSKFEKFDDGSAKALDDIMLPKGTICEFDHNETVHLLEDVRSMETNLFNSNQYPLFPGMDLIVSTENNPADYKSIGKAEIVVLDEGHIVRIHAQLGVLTSWTEEEFNMMRYSKLNEKINNILNENIIDKTNVLDISPMLKKIKF